MTNKNCEWYIIIRYTLEDYCGEMVDAIYAPSSVDALYIVTRGPKKPGECFRAFAAIGEVHTNTAIALSEKRRKADREWMLSIAHIEDAWLNATIAGMPVEPPRKR